MSIGETVKVPDIWGWNWLSTNHSYVEFQLLLKLLPIVIWSPKHISKVSAVTNLLSLIQKY